MNMIERCGNTCYSFAHVFVCNVAASSVGLELELRDAPRYAMGPPKCKIGARLSKDSYQHDAYNSGPGVE